MKKLTLEDLKEGDQVLVVCDATVSGSPIKSGANKRSRWWRMYGQFLKGKTATVVDSGVVTFENFCRHLNKVRCVAKNVQSNIAQRDINFYINPRNLELAKARTLETMIEVAKKIKEANE